MKEKTIKTDGCKLIIIIIIIIIIIFVQKMTKALLCIEYNLYVIRFPTAQIRKQAKLSSVVLYVFEEEVKICLRI
jgi:hypothetical protein